jgi:hypothetical protein
MSNITYSEALQRILFKAARDSRALAASVLDDVRENAELTGQTVHWAKLRAAGIAKQANALEAQGHEQCIASNLDNTLLSKSRDAYHVSINAFEARIKTAGGTLPV